MLVCFCFCFLTGRYETACTLLEVRFLPGTNRQVFHKNEAEEEGVIVCFGGESFCFWHFVNRGFLELNLGRQFRGHFLLLVAPS